MHALGSGVAAPPGPKLERKVLKGMLMTVGGRIVALPSREPPREARAAGPPAPFIGLSVRFGRSGGREHFMAFHAGQEGARHC